MSMVFDSKAFVNRRNQALSILDMDYARKMMPSATDEVRLIAMHKARYECVGIDATLRKASEAWLKERNYKRFDGTDFEKECGK